MLVKRDPNEFRYDPNYYKKPKRISKSEWIQIGYDFHLWGVHIEEEADRYCDQSGTRAKKSKELDKLFEYILKTNFKSDANDVTIKNLNNFIMSVHSQYTKNKSISKKQLVAILKTIERNSTR